MSELPSAKTGPRKVTGLAQKGLAQKRVRSVGMGRSSGAHPYTHQTPGR